MKKLLFMLSLVALSSFAWSLEVREGRLKLVVHENSGRFSLYYLSDIQKDRYEPLFVDKDPRTTFVAVLIDDRAQRLGDSAGYRTKVERTDGGARIVFESSILTVTQSFSFARSSGTVLADILRMDISASNKSDRELSVALRFVLDTNLAEKKSAHFTTNQRAIETELAIQPQTDSDSWWTTESDRLGLMGSVSVPDTRAPDSLHFANWKRLNDAAWKAAVSKGRNFNLLPYSINDSAVSYYFDAKPLPRGSERVETIYLGVANQDGFAGLGASGEVSELSRLMQKSIEDAGSSELTLQTDLVTVRDLLTRVDALLKSDTLTDDELAALEAIIARLKERNPTK